MPRSIVTRVSKDTYTAQYSKWLHIYPVLLQRNRWAEFNFENWSGKSYDVEKVSGRYREKLLHLSLAERDFVAANMRLKHSLQHERPLNERRMFASRTELKSALCLLPFRHWQAELNMLLFLLRTMPSRLSQYFSEIHRRIYESLNDLVADIGDMKRLYTLERRTFDASDAANSALVLHERMAGLAQERQLGFKEGRLLRLQQKQQGDRSYRHVTTHLKQPNTAARGSTVSPWNGFITFKTVMDENRIQWAKTGLLEAILALQKQMRHTRKELYEHTKFPTDYRYSTKPITAFRKKWFLAFRTQLDDWAYESPRSRKGSASLYYSLLDLETIQDYKIHARPDLVTEKEMELGREIYMKTYDKSFKGRKEVFAYGWVRKRRGACSL
jgi:hypothetical protein